MDFFNKLHYGRRNGMVLILVGLIFLTMNYIFINYSQSYSTKLLYVATICISLGVAMVVVPGANIQKSEVLDGASELILVIKNSSTFAKTVWVMAIIIGTIGGLLLERVIVNARF